MIEPQCPTCKALHAGFWLTDKGPAALHPYLPQPQAAAWHCSALPWYSYLHAYMYLATIVAYR